MEELVLPRAAVRELDRRAIEDYGVPSIVLMENAGRACAFEALALLAKVRTAGDVLVLCGSGNNGGDGFVIARTLANHGHGVRVVFTGSEEALVSGAPDARTNARAWRAMGGAIEVLDGQPSSDALRAALAQAPLVVDALFGTGLARPLRAEARTLVESVAARGTGAPLLAVDLPSGLDADTGEVLGAALRADVTVTFVARKPGFERGEGPSLAGRVVVAEIGIPRVLLEEAAGAAQNGGRASS